MGYVFDAAVMGLEALIRWLRIGRHRLFCVRPIVWVSVHRGVSPFVVPRCKECSIERAVVEKGWKPHARHP